MTCSGINGSRKVVSEELRVVRGRLVRQEREREFIFLAK